MKVGFSAIIEPVKSAKQLPAAAVKRHGDKQGEQVGEDQSFEVLLVVNDSVFFNLGHLCITKVNTLQSAIKEKCPSCLWCCDQILELILLAFSFVFGMLRVQSTAYLNW